MNKRVMLIGNPNCGKTTIFNLLTNSHQPVGNWSGVTIEQKIGSYTAAYQHFDLIDLPGVYALGIPEQMLAKDAQITAQAVALADMDLIINVVDACHLERQMYLTSQLLELGKPMLIALNMTDIATQRGIQIDTQTLARVLDCPVVVLQANRQIGVAALQQTLLTLAGALPPSDLLLRRLPQDIRDYYQKLQQTLAQQQQSATASYAYLAHRWMEQSLLKPAIDHPVIADLDLIVADARYQIIHEWVVAVQKKSSDAREHTTAKLDRWLLHRVWGLPIFFMTMYVLFFLAIDVGGAVQSGFDLLSKSFFVEGPEALLHAWHAPNWVVEIVAHGLGQSCNTIVTFIPVLGSMYFLLSFLEASGYMARAAFVVDRLMRALGLPGQAFVPMIVGFGCNVPAILAARTLQTERDRLLTVLMNPYMSCSARLAIYSVFVAIFFPQHGALIIFSLYLVGILMAVLTGFVVRNALWPNHKVPMILELPAYHRPTFKRLGQDTGLRLKYFLCRAGRVIVPICILLSCLNLSTSNQHQSLLARVSQYLSPIFTPMGISQDNWPAVVGLATGMLAKEVVIGTLNSLYVQLDKLIVPDAFNIWDAFAHASSAIYDKICALFYVKTVSFTPAMAGILQKQFGSWVAAYAYLLFVLLYIPCASTMAAIRQETSRKWMWFSIIWSLFLAYTVAVLFYQVATWHMHAHHRLVYLLGGILLGIGMGVHRLVKIGSYHAVRTA